MCNQQTTPTQPNQQNQSHSLLSVSYTHLDVYKRQVPVPLQHKDPYTLLIAVLLSAQCTDERVNRITPLLFAEADNPYKMKELPVQKIEEIIKPCGLSPTKSKAISQLSNILIEKHNGEVPKSFEALEKLPGVGHKTASVVMSQAFGIPAFPVDTHIQMCIRDRCNIIVVH